MNENEVVKGLENIIALTSVLNESANKYYNGLTPTLSDAEYDSMLTRLEELEAETGIQLHNSPLKRVGFEVLDSIPKKKLPRKMLSLDKIKDDYKALVKWIRKRVCLVMLKLDGLSCMLEYENGILVSCYTRGNGVEGSDVTTMVSSLPSVPNYIGGFTGYVIGELLIRESNFKRVNKEQEELGQESFANARNLATGTVLSLDTKLGRERGLEFIGFDVFGNLENVSSQEDKLHWIEDNKINIPHFDIISGVETDVVLEGYIISLKKMAEEQGVPIDGVVIGLNNIEAREGCKPTSKFPTHSIAFKFEDEYEESTVRDIEWSISRNGVLTPVAIFDTIILDGTEVSRANVHNVSILRSLEIGIGDNVKVVKANQIIPQIIENKTKSDSYEIPTVCPCCKSELRLDGDSVLVLRCDNVNGNCTEQEILKINHFLSKEALNAKGVSEKILKKLMSFGEISNIYDVFELPKRREELIKKNYPSMGRKTINNICDAIETSSNTTLERFLIGLGIDGVGSKVARDIVKKYPTVYDLYTSLSITGLKGIEGIDSTAESIYRGFKENFEHINKLLTYINIENVSQKVNGSSSLEGKIFVFTGKTSEFKNRKEVEEFIVTNGGKMSGSVSSKTSYLICNAVETSSKYKKAQELGIEIITDKQLKDMVE